MSQLPVKGQKQSVSQNKIASLQKHNPQPLQHKVQNQVGFYNAQQNSLAEARTTSAVVTNYKDLNEKKAGFTVHALYAFLVLLVGGFVYFYAMKIKPAKVEVVEKIVEKTIERVEYIQPEVTETKSYSKIDVEITIPELVEKAPEKNRFEADFKRDQVQRKYSLIRMGLFNSMMAERESYRNSKRGRYYDQNYLAIEHKYDELKAQLAEKEYNEICEVTEDSFYCRRAKQYTEALKNRAPASVNSYSPNYNENQPVYHNNLPSPANNGIDSVGKDVEEI